MCQLHEPNGPYKIIYHILSPHPTISSNDMNVYVNVYSLYGFYKTNKNKFNDRT